MKFLTRLSIAAAGSFLITGAAIAQNAEVTADVNMRAGPGSRYPIVTTIPSGRDISVHGCVSGYDWCDATWRGRRGWIFSDYIDYEFGSRLLPLPEIGASIDLPILNFRFGSYSDRHYRDEPWYRDRDRWMGRRNNFEWERDDRGAWRDGDRRGSRWDDHRQRDDARGGQGDCPRWMDDCPDDERADFDEGRQGREDDRFERERTQDEGGRSDPS